MATFRGGPAGGQIPAKALKKGLLWAVIGGLIFLSAFIMAAHAAYCRWTGKPLVEETKAVSQNGPKFGTFKLSTDWSTPFYLNAEKGEGLFFRATDGRELVGEQLVNSKHIVPFGLKGPGQFSENYRLPGPVSLISFRVGKTDAGRELAYCIWKGSEAPEGWFNLALLGREQR